MQFLIDIKNIFYPNICLSCEAVLSNNEHVVCTSCLYKLPLSYSLEINNLIVEKVFFGRVKVFQATALLSYQKKGITQKLIHQLKYRGHQEIGTYLGDWLGSKMIKSELFDTIDYIIPVPLHKKRLKKRGYNQVSTFGLQLSKKLKVPFIENILIRTSTNPTQTKKTRLERWKNVVELFYLTDTTIFENKHILLIDDILTTGATIEACANELFKTNNITISLAFMAITE